MPDRNQAWELLCEYTKGDGLRKHALAVEAAMRACVERYGTGEDDKDEWGLVGLLHDFDYEMFPTADQHPFTGANILCGRGYPDRLIRAIMDSPGGGALHLSADELIALCDRIAHASGGIFGIGRVSHGEREALAEIAAAIKKR